jgi:hypothetical protein
MSGNGKRFEPGKSGNPGGRPRVLAEVRDLARQHATTAIQTLADIASNVKAPPAARVAAATAILDRGYGKPTQPIDANVSVFDGLSPDELAGLRDAIADERARRVGGGGGAAD